MPILQDITDEVISLLTGYGFSQSRAGWLTRDVDASETQWGIDSYQSFGEGLAEVDDEVVYVRKFDSAGNTLTLAPDGRGYDGSVATTHLSGARVRFQPTFPMPAVKRAVNRAIERSFPTIWGVANTTLVYSASQATYALPAGTQGVLRVTYETRGPSGIWPESHNWQYDGNADTTKYPTGATITLSQALTPGLHFRVTTSTQPKALTDTDVSLSASGLQESSRYAVVLGACSQMLRFIDPTRLATDSAQGDEYDTKKLIGTASKIANDFELQYQRELDNQLAGLRRIYPARIHRRQF